MSPDLHTERKRAAVRLQALARGRAARVRVQLLREELARRNAFNDFCARVPCLGEGTPSGGRPAASSEFPTQEAEVVPSSGSGSDINFG